MKKDKMKKWIIVTAGLAISAVLIVMIGSKFKTAPVEDVEIPPPSSQTQEITVEMPEIIETVEPTVEEPETESESQILAETEVATETTEVVEQSIQPDPEKPKPTEDQLKDKTQTPDGEKVELPETPEEEKEQEIEQEKEIPVSSNPSGGLPGFDNVPDMGENTSIYVEDMYENGNKVGIMD